MQPGKHTAVVVDYGFTKTKAGKPQAAVTFETIEGGTRTGDRITWYGTLDTNSKGFQYTLKGLINCGMRTNDYRLVGEGVASGALDMDEPVQIVVENETYEGVTRTKVKWINTMRTIEFINPAQVQTMPDRTGDVMALRKELNMPLPEKRGWQ